MELLALSGDFERERDACDKGKERFQTAGNH